MRIVTEKIYLRPSLDFVFKSFEEMENHFIGEIVELLPSSESIKNIAINYFKTSDTVWYILNNDVCSEVILKEFETCNATNTFLIDVIDNTEYKIEAIWNKLSNSII